jgi:hypothetical protein
MVWTVSVYVTCTWIHVACVTRVFNQKLFVYCIGPDTHGFAKHPIARWITLGRGSSVTWKVDSNWCLSPFSWGFAFFNEICTESGQPPLFFEDSDKVLSVQWFFCRSLDLCEQFGHLVRALELQSVAGSRRSNLIDESRPDHGSSVTLLVDIIPARSRRCRGMIE